MISPVSHTSGNIPDQTLGFLGPEGSHSHQAVLGLLEGGLEKNNPNPLAQLALKPYPTLIALLRAVEEGAVASALLPYENALEGSVVEVLEALGKAEQRLYVLAELLHPVVHCLIQPPGASGPVHTVLSHPQALAQCRQTLEGLFGPNLIYRATASTSEAVEQVSDYYQTLQASQPSLTAANTISGMAAIGTQTAAQHYNLQVSHHQISDLPDNLTRFFWVGHQPGLGQSLLPQQPLQALPLKTSLCLGLPEYAGVLMDCLHIFKTYGVNLTKLESRPSRKKYGEYMFYLDAEGDITQVADGAFLQELKAFTTFLSYQGPYVCLGKLDSPSGESA